MPMHNKLEGFISETSTSIAFYKESRGVQNIGVRGIAHLAMEVIVASRLHIGSPDRKYHDRYIQNRSTWELGECSGHARRQELLTPHKSFGRNHVDLCDTESMGGSSDNSMSRAENHITKKENTGRLSVCEESRKKTERCHQARDLESTCRQRERQGLRGHFLSVNEDGIPYGPGVGSWRAELSKLYMALNPTVMDIQW
jgi:hypothetical protein